MKKTFNILIVLAILSTPHLVVQAYQTRGYYAIGGEWLIVPLAALIVYGFIPSTIKLSRACSKEEIEKVNKNKFWWR